MHGGCWQTVIARMGQRARALIAPRGSDRAAEREQPRRPLPHRDQMGRKNTEPDQRGSDREHQYATSGDILGVADRFAAAADRGNFPLVAQSMDRFIDCVKQETHGEILGDLEVVRIPLDLYRARNATNRQWLAAGANSHPFASSPVFLAGDSAIGSPYFQSISLGFECAMFLAGLVAERDLPLNVILDRYELFIYKQWLRVYMRSKMIKHNKDLFECLDDRLAILQKLHIY